MGRRKKKNKSGQLGRALQRNKRDHAIASKRVMTEHARHAYMDDMGPDGGSMFGAGSITETTDLTSFLEAAELADREFRAERGVAVVVTAESAVTHSLLPSNLEEEDKVRELLTVPRRPYWDGNMTKDELITAEKRAFLEWRSQLAQLESNKAVRITPFEKNINMWRQLWRVVEKAHIVVQIVDARNPGLFRTPELESYVTDLDANKRNVLIVNKADLVPRDIRVEWANHWADNGVEAVFFSAAAEQAKLDAAKAEAAKAARASASSSAMMEGDALVADDPDTVAAAAAAAAEALEQVAAFDHLGEYGEFGDPGHVASRTELIGFLTSLAQQVKDTMEAAPTGGRSGASRTEPRAVIGLVGYPNVGKSSTINALYGEKKTSVAATPGKTKHFQTLILSEEVMLCDCPGLVFPSFVSSQAEMVCSGILPIDNLRSYYGPVSLVCQRIPRPVLEKTYGVGLPPPGEAEDPNRPPYVSELLQAYAYNRGYMTQRGPDESRASRTILKDYVSGKLLYCFRPNQTSQDEEAAVAAASASASVSMVPTADSLVQQPMEGMRTDIDAGFISNPSATPGTRTTGTNAILVTPRDGSAPASSTFVTYSNSKMAKDRAKIDAEFFSQTSVSAVMMTNRKGQGSHGASGGFASKKERRAAKARAKAQARAARAARQNGAAGPSR